MKTNQTPAIDFHKMIEAMPSGMAYARLAFDQLHKPKDFTFLGMNHSFIQFTGLPREFLTGKNASALMAEQQQEEMNFLHLLFKAVILESKCAAEFYFMPPGKCYLATVFTFDNIFLAISLQDITGQRNSEAQGNWPQPHLEELAGDYDGSGIAHDSNLNNPNIQNIRYLIFHDKLTGLYNRAFFDEELARLDTGRQLPLSIIMGDVNGLKLTNDVFGHSAGDQLLKNVAGILKASFRNEELIARWGGDEFSILLPSTPYEEALKLINRIKEKCAAAESNPIKPSIALGLSTKTHPDQDLFGVIKEAENSMYSNKLSERKVVRRAIVNSFEKIIQKKNPACMEHCRRVSALSEKFARYINLTADERDALNKLSWFHDIGAVRISESIMKKSTALSPKEWLEIREHPGYGYRIAQLIPEIAFISELILSHHENWDGSGYPQKLKGREIPKLSRIFFLIDTYDVITHDRPFKTALSHVEAVNELNRCAGTYFDPYFTKYFTSFINDCSSHQDCLETGNPPAG